jgi:hypothetical protein
LPPLDSSKEDKTSSIELSTEELYEFDNKEFYKSYDFGKRRVISKLEDSLEMKGLADSVSNFLKQSSEIQEEL